MEKGIFLCSPRGGDERWENLILYAFVSLCFLFPFVIKCSFVLKYSFICLFENIPLFYFYLGSLLWGRAMGESHLVCMTTNVGECFTPILLIFNLPPFTHTLLLFNMPLFLLHYSHLGCPFKFLTRVLNSIPWVRCASGNVFNVQRTDLFKRSC